MPGSNFEWDAVKDLENQEKHGVSFYEAQYAFADENRVIAEDGAHSRNEIRYFCFGLNRHKTGILNSAFYLQK